MKKILIVKTSSMGDVLHTLPALTDAASHLPDATFDWIVEEGFAEIPKWHPAVTNVIPLALRRWRKQFSLAWQRREIQVFVHRLRIERYDYIIDAQGLIKSAMVGLLAKGKTYGYAADSIKEPVAAFFYGTKWHIAKQQHAIARIRQLFAASLGYAAPDTLPNYGIELQKIAALLTTAPVVAESKPYLVFFHATSSPLKCWSENKWIRLCNLIGGQFCIKLPWGNADEQARAQRIAAVCGNAEVLPKLNLTSIAQLLSGAVAVVTMDTGLGHLAAALNLPTVALYGNTDPKLIGVIGSRVAYLTDFNNVSAEQVWDKLKALNAG